MRHLYKVRLSFHRNLSRGCYASGMGRSDPERQWIEKKLVTRFMPTESEYLCHKRSAVHPASLLLFLTPFAVVQLLNPHR